MPNRSATDADLPLLAQRNREPIEDERADSPMSVARARRRRWLRFRSP